MKRILIDTHILIWWLAEPNKIKDTHLELISAPDNLIFVSTASFFEIALKIKKGKIAFDCDFQKLLTENSFENLSISLRHLQTLPTLDFPNQDPFDMLIITQAIIEDLELISYDGAFKDMERLKLIG